jgi:DNA-binding LacI/PurR family transcriptional regulator
MVIPPRRTRSTVTLTDVANACGIALSTASRALSDPNRVSTDMYRRVVAKAEELGYITNRSVPGSATMDRGLLVLMVQNMINPYQFELIRGSQAQAQTSHFLLSVVNCNESVQLEADSLRQLGSIVDGIVLHAPRGADEIIQEAASQLPIVVTNREVPGVASVIVDTPGGMASAVDHLARLGHKSVAYVGGPTTSWSDGHRYRALQAATRVRGMACERVGWFVASVEAGAAAAEAVLLTDATAVVFFNDVLAIGGLRRFSEKGIRVPEDISVIGCDDILAASFCMPPLTTLASDGENVGRLATDMLINRLTSTARARVIERLPVHLTIRQSTGPAPFRPNAGEEPSRMVKGQHV